MAGYIMREPAARWRWRRCWRASAGPALGAERAAADARARGPTPTATGRSRRRAAAGPEPRRSAARRPRASRFGASAPNPISKPFAALLGRSGATTALDAKQRALVDRVSAYLSSMQMLSGNFVQVGPDGRRTEGEFYTPEARQGALRIQPPSPIELIADGQSVVVRDRKLATQDLYPLSQTPLRFLLADRIDLMQATPTWSASMPTTCSSPW